MDNKNTRRVYTVWWVNQLCGDARIEARLCNLCRLDYSVTNLL